MSRKKKNGGFQRIVEQKINEYLLERFGLERAGAGKKQVGLAFSEFCVKDVFAPLHDFGDSDQIEDGLNCDDSGDLGVDFIYRKEDQYHILQMKYRSGGGNLPPAEVHSFLHTDGRIVPRRGGANQDVLDLLADLGPASAIEYYLVTNCRISDALKKEFRRGREEVARETVEWHMLDGAALMEKHEEALSAEELIPDKVSVSVRAIASAFSPAAAIPCGLDLTDCLVQAGGRHRSVVTVVTGREIKALYDPNLGGFGRNLFHANIRGHLGEHNKVNVALTDTLKNKPQDFYLFNNGISALCDSMRIHPTRDGGGAITCRKFQIINGAQTVSTIGRFGDDALLEKVNVLLRITEPGGDEGEDALRRQIIRNNNSQTAMRHSDFRSNDPIQKRIEHEFKSRGVTYRHPPHKKVVYQRRREKAKLPKNHMAIAMESLAKALFAYSEEDNPSLLYSQSSFLFSLERDMGGKYPALFWDGGNEITSWPAKRVVRTIAIALLNIYLERRLKDKRKPFERGDDGGRNNIKFMSYSMRWQILWAFGTVVRKFHQEAEDEIYRRIVQDNGCLVAGGFVHRWFGLIEQIIQGILSFEQRILEKGSGKGATLNFKAWMRDPNNAGKIKDMIEIRGEEFSLS